MNLCIVCAAVRAINSLIYVTAIISCDRPNSVLKKCIYEVVVSMVSI